MYLLSNGVNPQKENYMGRNISGFDWKGEKQYEKKQWTPKLADRKQAEVIHLKAQAKFHGKGRLAQRMAAEPRRQSQEPWRIFPREVYVCIKKISNQENAIWISELI